VFSVVSVVSGRGLCDELITLPEESYRLLCVVVCDLETSRMRRPWPAFYNQDDIFHKLETERILTVSLKIST